MGYRELVRKLLEGPRWIQGLLVSAVLASLASVAAATEPVVIVVHPTTNVTSVTKAELSKIYLKRLRTWASGELARPVDQIPGPLRESFSRTVHERSVTTIELYWKRMIFSGRAVPPPEAEGDEAVLEFVCSTPGAVGYVRLGTDLHCVRTLSLEP